MRIRCIFLLVIMLSSIAHADVYIGAGTLTKIPGENTNEEPIIATSIRWEQDTDNPWFIAANYTDSYLVYGTEIKEHLIVASGKRIIDYKYFYFDFGLAATSQISIVNSSRIMFYENIGFKYDGFRIGLSHQSNAGLKPPNEGETIISFEYLVEF